MESGERELKKAFEEVTTRNVKAAVEHGNETRRLTRELEQKVTLLQGTMRQYDDKLSVLSQQIVNLQMKIYKGGTDGNIG